MADSFSCPNCGMRYAMVPQLAGRHVRCSRCNEVFPVQVTSTRCPAGPAASPTPPPPAGQPAPSSPTSGGFSSLLDEAFGPASNSAGSPPLSPLTAGPPLGALRPSGRGRGSGLDRLLLGIGAALAAISVICLAFLLPALGSVSFESAMLALMVGLVGAGLLAYALRGQIFLAGGIAAAIVLLLVLGAIIGSNRARIGDWSASDGPVPDEPIPQMAKMLELMESIQDETRLKAVGPKVIYLFCKMLNTANETQSPDAQQKIAQALPEFCQRMSAAGTRVRGLRGGASLTAELVRLMTTWRPIGRLPRTRIPTRQRCQALTLLAQVFHKFCLANDRAPADWEAVEGFLAGSPNELAAVRQLRAEGVVAQWGVGIRECTCGTSNFVLAYDKDATELGGAIARMDGSWSVELADNLRTMLNSQAPVVEAATGVKPPVWPSLYEAELTAPPNVASWVCRGWSTPAPPEPPENRARRVRKPDDDRDPRPDTVVVTVYGIPGDAIAQRIASTIVRLHVNVSGGMTREVAGRGEYWVTAPDMRAFASALDLGPISNYWESAGNITLRLDMTRLAPLPPVQSVAAFPPLPTSEKPPVASVPAVPSSGAVAVAPADASPPSGSTPPSSAPPGSTAPSPASPRLRPFGPMSPGPRPPVSTAPVAPSPPAATPGTGTTSPASPRRRSDPLLPGHSTFGPRAAHELSQAANRGRKLEAVGGANPGGPYQFAVPAGHLTGIAYQTGSWGNEPGFRRILPLGAGSQASGAETVVAKDGYAIGGFVVNPGQFFHALRIIFMRIRPDGRLDPDDTYQSDWIGTPMGKATLTVSSKGDKVIGIHGRGVILVHTIGLIVE